MQPDDKQIRACLHASLRDLPQKGTRIVDEWETGKSRIDVAMIASDAITGWEIKSDRDSCARLAQQANDYSDLCNYAWAVCGPKIAPKVEAKLPYWWGVLIADGEPLEITVRRSGQHNPRISVAATLHRLWGVELRDLIAKYSLPLRLRRQGKTQMVDALHATGRLVELRTDALRTMLDRTTWRTQAA